MNLSVVLPAYNEAESLQLLLPALKAELALLTSDFEILIIDTQEPLDNTAEICQAMQVRHIPRRGGKAYGDAVRTGIEEAQGVYILFMDADGSHNPKQLAGLWEKREAADIVIGSRYIKGGVTENPPALIIMSFMVNFVFRLAFRLRCHDVTNSLRIYRAYLIKKLTLRSNNFDIIEEILIKLVAGLDKATVVEVPITFEQRKAGYSKRSLLAFAMTYLSTLFRLMKFRSDARHEISAATK